MHWCFSSANKASVLLCLLQNSERKLLYFSHSGPGQMTILYKTSQKKFCKMDTRSLLTCNQNVNAPNTIAQPQHLVERLTSLFHHHNLHVSKYWEMLQSKQIYTLLFKLNYISAYEDLHWCKSVLIFSVKRKQRNLPSCGITVWFFLIQDFLSFWHSVQLWLYLLLLLPLFIYTCMN